MPSLPPRWRAAELLAPTADLARALLGSYLYRRTAQGLIIATITETEAYGGTYDSHPDDASHAFRGRTDRNAPMFAAPGIIYVYLVYGMHHCVNIVTERERSRRLLPWLVRFSRHTPLRHHSPRYQV